MTAPANVGRPPGLKANPACRRCSGNGLSYPDQGGRLGPCVCLGWKGDMTLAQIVEEAGSYGAAFAVRDRGQRVVGVANTTNFIRAVTGGRILVEALPVQQGRTQQFWEVRMTQAETGALVALGHLRLQNLEPRP